MVRRRSLLYLLLSWCWLWKATATVAEPTKRQQKQQHSFDSFNYEVQKRIEDHLIHFLGDPSGTNEFIATYRRNGGFPYNMTARDRDDYLRLVFSLVRPLVYYGLEDGTSVGSWTGYSFYREPGQSAYPASDPNNQMHFKACIDTWNGTQVDCLMVPGAPYVKYSCDYNPQDVIDNNSIIAAENYNDANDDDCSIILEPCPDEQSQRDCEATTPAYRDECRANRTWCRRYSIETVTEQDLRNGDANGIGGWGFVPVTRACHNSQGLFTQEPGQALDVDGGDALGNCTYADGVTLVQRTTVGPYAYCGNGNGNENKTWCNPFEGSIYTDDFDPRYRPWYVKTKELQTPHWSAPYVFRSRDIGITHCHPIYTETEYGRRFDGVMAIDYLFEDFSSFLEDNYGGTPTLVAVYEDAAPHYVIGTSTGSDAAGLYLSTDHSVPCNGNNGYLLGDCDTLRVPMRDLSGSPLDAVLVATFEKHAAAGYPTQLLPIKTSGLEGVESRVYITQSTLFELGGVNIKWRIVIASPGAQSEGDAITVGSVLFGVIIAIAALGFVSCLALFVACYRKRRERQIAFTDWRFTCAFLIGCALLNVSSFFLLGPNTDTTCMLRMWSFHLLFAVALAPLFVKVWRIKLLVGMDTGHRRRSITNKSAFLWTLPIVGAMIILLLIISFVDPPEQTTIVETQDGEWVQRTVCDTETKLLLALTLAYEGCLVLVGCILAWMTRKLHSEFGESKQLIFAMYNIAVVGTVFVIVINVASLDGAGQKMLKAIGVFWGTVASAAIMAVPRLLRLKATRNARGQVHVSGVTHTSRNTAEGSTSTPIPSASASSNEASKPNS